MVLVAVIVLIARVILLFKVLIDNDDSCLIISHKLAALQDFSHLSGDGLQPGLLLGQRRWGIHVVGSPPVASLGTNLHILRGGDVLVLHIPKEELKARMQDASIKLELEIFESLALDLNGIQTYRA